MRARISVDPRVFHMQTHTVSERGTLPPQLGRKKRPAAAATSPDGRPAPALFPPFKPAERLRMDTNVQTHQMCATARLCARKIYPFIFCVTF